MAESYPLPFGGGFSLPQLLLFAASPLPCAGPRYRDTRKEMRNTALGGGTPAPPPPHPPRGPQDAPPPAPPGALRAAFPPAPSCLIFPLRVLLPSPAR